MSDTTNACTAFIGSRKLASGPVKSVARKLVQSLDESERQSVLVFDDSSGRRQDLDLHGSMEDVLARLEAPEPQPPKRRGRPRLGVVPKEVTLLPRHWDWLAAQPGGASVTLRKLVDSARQNETGCNAQRQAQEACYHVMQALAGDLPGYEAALRALYANDQASFEREVDAWPRDIGMYLASFAAEAFASPDPND